MTCDQQLNVANVVMTSRHVLEYEMKRVAKQKQFKKMVLLLLILWAMKIVFCFKCAANANETCCTNAYWSRIQKQFSLLPK